MEINFLNPLLQCKKKKKKKKKMCKQYICLVEIPFYVEFFSESVSSIPSQ